jgi:hypothetical protein
MLAAMLPRLGSSKLVSGWIKITLIASIVTVVDGGWLASWLALEPARIWHGELWRLASWVFVVPGPLMLVLTCACIYSLGGDLAHRWGDRRLRRFLIEIVGGAAVATAVIALVIEPIWHLRHVGGWAVCDTLVIAWARQYPDRVLRLYGLLELSGRNLIAVTIGVTCLYALYAGVFAMAPELLACAAAYYYPRARLMS